jgi:hypothetical protein
LERMKQTDSRAAIVEHEGQYRLYMNRQVVEAWRDRTTFCSELVDYVGQKVIPFADPIEMAGEIYLRQLAEQYLDKYHADFGLLFFPKAGPRAVAHVITRYEDLASNIRGANKVCACRRNKHVKESPPAQEGGDCGICGSIYDCY